MNINCGLVFCIYHALDGIDQLSLHEFYVYGMEYANLS